MQEESNTRKRLQYYTGPFLHVNRHLQKPNFHLEFDTALHIAQHVFAMLYFLKK